MVVNTLCRISISRAHQNSSHIIPCILIIGQHRQTWRENMEDKLSEAEMD